MPRQYVVAPQFTGDVFVGTDGDDTKVYLGQVAETGGPRRVYFGGSQEFVVMIIGKRGSGKSHTLGTILESLATREQETSISSLRTRRAALLLDPMGNFWTTAHLVSSNGPEKVKKQWASLDGWNCKPEEIDVQIWLPAGFKTANDPDGVQEFRISASDLDAADVADLIGINLMKDAQGAALAEAFIAVTEEGYTDGGPFKAPKPEYAFSDIIEYLEYLRLQNTSDHSPTTLRALIRSLRALERQPVFSGAGTPMTEVLKAGRLSVLMLPLRVGADLRRVVTRLLIRRILREREQASQIRQRLDIETLDEKNRLRLEEELARRMPRSILALDEAQELLGDEGGEARQALENFCLLGRNYGLSLILATQRPLASAISTKVRSQVDLQIIHRLLTQDDINTSQANLLALYPREVTDGDHDLDFAQLVRSLDRGQAIISASHARARDPLDRIIVARIRPRITVHGGEVS